MERLIKSKPFILLVKNVILTHLYMMQSYLNWRITHGNRENLINYQTRCS